VKFLYGTNGILAQKNSQVRVIEQKYFARMLTAHPDFFALSSGEKITAAQSVQLSKKRATE
jgi:hypothetical protein